MIENILVTQKIIIYQLKIGGEAQFEYRGRILEVAKKYFSDPIQNPELFRVIDHDPSVACGP